jgi:hypothetical protein
MRALKFTVLTFLAITASGCRSSVSESLWDQINTLEDEKQQLSREAETLKSENLQLNSQVKTLSGFDASERQNVLPTIEKITLTKRTGFVDRDKDGKKEKLAVYIKPYDKKFDVIKSAASVSVHLWDLEAEPAKSMIGQWDISPEELSEMWMGAFMTGYYRVLLDVDMAKLEEGKGYTIKVTFTEYITGKVFKQQMVRNP